jgi:hypothetical protein
MVKKVSGAHRTRSKTPWKGQLDLEFHGGRSREGVAIRVAQRVLALAAAICFTTMTAAAVTRSLIAFDH